MLSLTAPCRDPSRVRSRVSRLTQAHSIALAFLLTAIARPLPAQDERELANLMFDPVPIRMEALEDGSTLAIELHSLPQGEGVTPGAWLAANQPQASQVSEPQLPIQALEQAVRELEINEGPFSANLPQQLQSLATALQRQGEYEQAQEYFQRATHVTRVNHGLFSEAQFPYIRYSIENQLLQGNLLAADEQQRYLFYLQQRNNSGDSAALLPALEAFAEWNIFAFNAPAVIPALSLDANGPVDEAMFRVQRLLNAQHIYWSIAQILVDNFGNQDPRLPDAEKRIALTNYFFATTISSNAEALNLGSASVPTSASTSGLASAPMMGNLGYRQGRDALERRRDYLANMATTADDQEQVLRASLDVADWMLYFSRQRMKAVELYESLPAGYVDVLPPDQLHSILNPPYPEQLPTFIKPAWSRAALGLPADLALAYHGHIDVEFELNRFGRTTGVKVLGASDPQAQEVEQRLLRKLRRAQFRPRFDGEKLRLSDTLQVRYYYSW